MSNVFTVFLVDFRGKVSLVFQMTKYTTNKTNDGKRKIGILDSIFENFLQKRPLK